MNMRFPTYVADTALTERDLLVACFNAWFRTISNHWDEDDKNADEPRVKIAHSITEEVLERFRLSYRRYDDEVFRTVFRYVCELQNDEAERFELQQQVAYAEHQAGWDPNP